MSDQITIVFLGSPAFSCPFLQALAADPRFHVQAVITQEDKPSGRKKILTPTPVKKLALDLGLPVFQPHRLNKDSELIEWLARQSPDFLLTVAYGQLISQKVLDLPKIAPLNVHGSILPAYRGASPLEQSLLNGDRETGLSIMQMVLEMDAGPVYSTIRETILPEDNDITLRQKLAEKGSRQLPDLLMQISKGQLKAYPQDSSAASYCQKISKSDGLIDPSTQSAEQIYNRFRAFIAWPGTYLMLDNRQLKLLDIKLAVGQPVESGQFLVAGQRLFLGCQIGSIEINKLQLEGKKAQSSSEFLRGNSRLFQ